MTEPPLPEESLFAQALEIASAAERAAFLDRACGENPALRAEVEALLHAHDRSADLLDLPDNLTVTTDLPSRERPGTLVGPYKLLEQIGEGGMGTVWMAEQTEPIRRRVAVKVIKEGMDSGHVLARFEAERQALALMEHPNIAKVLDAGRTPSGRPYFVMELVKGQPITTYCDEKRLGVRQRLELFADACRAVQHAHQKGIIHRDVKPSNVLVAPYDGRPVVKVIDFGVAKATGQSLTDKTLFTEFGALVGTPEYMSPEQAEINNQDVDTRSDIYSLGVLLYELLTGSTPLTRKRVREVALFEVLRVIREEEPPKPSTRLSTTDEMPSVAANRGLEPNKLSGLVRGELDWIVMKALDKDRNRRYETANGFAGDVQRYLADEAVQACPPSTGYRFRKFARRNKGALSTATLVATALLVGTAVSVWQAVRATHALENERQTRASLDRERTQINGKIGDTLQEMAALRAKARTTGPATGRHWADLQEVARRAETLAGSELAEPALVEQVRSQLELVRLGAKNSRMSARLEGIRLDSLAVQPGTPAHHDVGNDFAAAFRDYDLPVIDLPAAEAAVRVRASDIRDDLLASLDAWSALDARAGGTAWKGLLTVAQAADDHPWRRECRDAALRTDRRSMVQLARREDSPRQPAGAVLLLAGILAMSPPGRPATGEELLAGGELMAKAAVWHPGDAGIAFGLNAWFPSRSQGGDAVAVARENIERLKHDAADSVRLADGYANLGRLLQQKRDLVGAASAYRQAVRLVPGRADYRTSLIENLPTQDEIFAACSDWIESGPQNSLPYCRLGVIYNIQQQWPQALANLVKATELNPQEAWVWDLRAQVHRSLGQYPEAVVASTKAIETAQREGQYQVYYLETRAYTYKNLKQWDNAIADATRAIDLEPKQGYYRVRRGDIYLEKGDKQKALADYDMGIQIGGSKSPSYGFVRRADLNEQLGRWDKAISDWSELEKIPGNGLAQRLVAALITCPDRALRDPRRALALDQKSGQRLWASIPDVRCKLLGMAHFQLGEWKETITEMAKIPDRHPYAGFYLAIAHWHLGNHDEAQKCYDRAIKIAEQGSFIDEDRKEVHARWDEAKELLASPKKKK